MGPSGTSKCKCEAPGLGGCGVVWCGVVGQLFIAPDPVKMCLLSFSSCSLSLLGKLLFANRGFSAVRTRTWWLLC